MTRPIITAAAALALVSGLAAVPAGAEEVRLRGVSAFATGTSFSAGFAKFIERVNDTGKGTLRIEYMGGPDAMPPFEVGNAVRRGVVDIANTTAAFYTAIMPVMDGLKLAEISIAEQRRTSAYEFIDKLHRERMNVVYLARQFGEIPFHLYLTRPIDKPDLSGLRLRVTPVYRAFFEALGATVVTTAPGEVYTALERGVVDGYGWPVQGIFDLGWHEVTKFRVDPGFYRADVDILVNLDVWNRLDEAQQKLLRDAALWLEQELSESDPKRNESERRRQDEHGIQTISFAGADREKWLNAARQAGWDAVIKADPENGPKLRELLTRN